MRRQGGDEGCQYAHFATHGIPGLDNGRPPSLVLSLVGDQQGEDGFLQLDEVRPFQAAGRALPRGPIAGLKQPSL